MAMLAIISRFMSMTVAMITTIIIVTIMMIARFHKIKVVLHRWASSMRQDNDCSEFVWLWNRFVTAHDGSEPVEGVVLLTAAWPNHSDRNLGRTNESELPIL